MAKVQSGLLLPIARRQRRAHTQINGGLVTMGKTSGRSQALLLLLAASFVASAANAKPLPGRATASHEVAASSDQRTAASRLAQTFADTWNRRDGRGYGEAYWPDAELVDPSGQLWTGRQAIVQTHIDLWAGPAKRTHMTAHVRRVRALAPNLFVVDIDTSASGFSPPPPGAPDGLVRTRLKHVVERRHGEWKIVTSQNTFVSAQ